MRGKWRREHPGEDIPGGHVFTRFWPVGATANRWDSWDQVVFYQYKTDRAGRTLRGISEQVAGADPIPPLDV